MNLINSYVHAVVGGGFVPRTPDANFSNVAFLIHADGTDGQTTFVDAAPTPKTWTRQGNAKVDTTTKKFGTGAAILDGTGDWLSTPDDAAFDVGSNDYCIEGWFYVDAWPAGGNAGLLTKYNFTIVMPFDINLFSDGHLVYQVGNFDGSITPAPFTTAGGVFTTGVWHHVAFSRDGVNVRGFLDGVIVGSDSSFVGGTAGGDNNAEIQIGGSPASVPLLGWFDEVRFTIGNARYTANFTPPAEPFWSPYVIQQSFRLYNDDGSESAMTAAAAQDTNLTGSIGTTYIVRMQLDSTGDVPSTIWRLEYKKSTDATWVPVLIAAPALPTFNLVASEVFGAGDITPLWPSHVPGDLALLFIESAGGEAANLSVPAGFQAVLNSPSFTGSGTSGTRVTVYWCRAVSDSMPNPTVQDPGDHAYARIMTFKGVIADGDPWNVTAASQKASASTSADAPAVTTTQNNCLIVNIVSRDNDASGQGFSAVANANLASISERSDGGTTSGNGGGIGLYTGTLATAGNSGMTTVTVTSSINASLTIALRPQTIPVLLALSANITAGGQATTARLTAPAGKTTGDFVTGRIWDNENGTDAINITADDYTELAWSIVIQSPAASGHIYQFRVTQAGLPLEHYAQIPSITV